MSHSILHTPIAQCIAAITNALAERGTVGVCIDDDGCMRIGDPSSADMRAYMANHPHLTMTIYTRAIKPCDLLADIANRMGELSTYGKDRVHQPRRKRR